MSLRPFSCPLPETRFLQAGRSVYKFKIRYGNFNNTPDLDNMESVTKELEEAIRVILGNLDDLHPFSTEHFTIFPYLSKWERVSKMRFQHENTQLVPYPYICSMYLELNSFQQNVSGVYNVWKVKRRNEVSESTVVEETVKRRRLEVGAEASCPQLGVISRGECACRGRNVKHGLETGDVCDSESYKEPTQGFLTVKLQAQRNCSKETVCEFNPASLAMGCNQVSFWGPVESNLEPRAATKAEGSMQLCQQTDQMVTKGNGMESAGRGLSLFWRSIVLSPLKHLFGGKK